MRSQVAVSLAWLRARDAKWPGLRRAGRGAIVVPGLLALGDKVLGNGRLAGFAAFGAIAMVLLVDFGGPMAERLAAQAWLVVTGAILVGLGTLAGRPTWLAAAAMFAVGFVVLFAGVVSSALAGSSTSLLLGFMLAVTSTGPASSIPDRLIGWLLAGGASLIAVALLWPAPAREPLSMPVAGACRLLARRLRAEVVFTRSLSGPDRAAAHAAATEATAAITSLRSSFFATPYRASSLTTPARTLVHLVDELMWLDSILGRMPATELPGRAKDEVSEVKLAASALLDDGAALLDHPAADPGQLEPGLDRLREAREAMEQAATHQIPARRARAAGGTGGMPGDAELIGSLHPCFRAHELSYAVWAIVGNIQTSVAARRRSWLQQLTGRRPAGTAGPLSSVQRASARLEPHSVWLHNSLRGATALALAVTVADLTAAQHSFWVVLGTLAVLRSNALSTGQEAVRGLLGNAAGFVIGGAVVLAIGAQQTALWVIFPLAVFFAGLAPAAISFAAGQAAFTVTLVILYNIIAPTGWKVGLIRVEDVAIGCAVSLAVGALFWPRGAGTALGQALAEAYSENASYLGAAVKFGQARCERRQQPAGMPRAESMAATAAAQRLDDAFRSFLAERGSKHLRLADVTTLVSGAGVLRLTAAAVVDLWKREEEVPAGAGPAGCAEVLATTSRVISWISEAARAMAGLNAVPEPLAYDPDAEGRLLDAIHRDISADGGQGTATAVKLVWTADHIDAARRLQSQIAAPAGAAARRRGRKSGSSRRRLAARHLPASR